MSKNLALKDFELQSVKYAGKCGLEIKFFDINDGNTLWTASSDSQPHEDYSNALNALKEVLAYSLELNQGWDFAKEHNRKNEDLLRKALQFWKDEIEKCNVSGISVFGAGDSKGIKISGSLKTELGVVGLASPKVRFDDEIVNSIDETIMIGDLAETAFTKIQQEVWAFIFKGKRGGELFPPEKIESGLNVTMQKVG
jgi:hypothetical protein